MSSVLIVTAHLDDFEIGMGGTAAKLCLHHDVHLVVLCKGDRPGHEHVSSTRKQSCAKNCMQIGLNKKHFYDYSDTKLDQIPQTELCNLIHEHIDVIKPIELYTNHSEDIHADHRIVSKVCRVAARPRASCSIKRMYEFSIPGSTEWSNTGNVFNTFVNVTDQHHTKVKMISGYESEIRESPDPISIEMIQHRDSYIGSLCGYRKAEAFKLIYSR